MYLIQLFLFVIFFLFLLEASGQTSPGNLVEEAKKEGKVIFYTSTSVSASKPLLDGFRSRYPFIEPELNRVGGTALLNRIVNEAKGGKHSVDVIEARAEFITPLKKAGLLTKYDSAERRYYPENLKDKEGYWTAFSVNLNTPGYNSRLVSPNELPRTYEAMLHPRWAPVEWYPIEPVPTLLFVVMIPGKAPHPASASLLTDYMLSKDGQEFVRKIHRVPARDGIEPDPPRLKKSLKWYVADPEEGGDYSEIVSLYRKTFGLK